SEGDHPQLECGEMRRAAVLPKKGERRGDPARGLREISLAQGAPEGISALLRPAVRGAARVRAGHGHRTITVSKHRTGLAVRPGPALGPGRCPPMAPLTDDRASGSVRKGPAPVPLVGNRTAAWALQKKPGGVPPCQVPRISADKPTSAYASR